MLIIGIGICICISINIIVSIIMTITVAIIVISVVAMVIVVVLVIVIGIIIVIIISHGTVTTVDILVYSCSHSFLTSTYEFSSQMPGGTGPPDLLRFLVGALCGQHVREALTLLVLRLPRWKLQGMAKTLRRDGA